MPLNKLAPSFIRQYLNSRTLISSTQTTRRATSTRTWWVKLWELS